MSASLLALLLAVSTAFSTPRLLAWLPSPAEAPAIDFGKLTSPRFWLATFVVVYGVGWPVLAITDPTLWPVWAPLLALGTVLGLIDANTTFLPLRLHYLAFAACTIGVVLSAWWRGDWALLAWAGGGAALASALYWLIWRLSRGQLGFGDVRLAGLLGLVTAATSPAALFWSFWFGSIIGALWAIAVRLRGGSTFAYGPSMLLGAPLGLIAATITATAI